MDCLHYHIARFRDSFFSTDHLYVSVVSFKSEVLSAVERFIPSKMTKTKFSLPWIDSSIKCLIRNCDKLDFRARKSSSPDITIMAQARQLYKIQLLFLICFYNLLTTGCFASILHNCLPL